jgi:Fic family protein
MKPVQQHVTSAIVQLETAHADDGRTMDEQNIKHIWPPETGITDIETDWRTLRASEIDGIGKIWSEQRERLKGTKQLAEFSERLSREWAIETGIIENLYDIERGITQTLIERGFHADLLVHGSTNQPPNYVIKLLQDQKATLDGIFDFISQRRELSTSYIKELHAALLRSQTHTDAVDALGRDVVVPVTRGDWKTLPNSPTRDGTLYRYSPPEQVASEMDRFIALHRQHRNQQVAPDVQAAWLHHRFTQIHPFQDGNGRVARALASLVLVQSGLFPLVVTRDDRIEYLDALEAADNGELKPLVDLIARLQRAQFRQATAISENILAAEADVQQVLGGLLDAAAQRQEHKLQTLRRVFTHAEALAGDVATRLETICPGITTALQRVTPSGTAFVTRSNNDTDHYYRSQIIYNARYHLKYFANTSDYRAWVCLNMVWERKARLVFAFHGIGRPFSGSLVSAPFLEFRDADDEGHIDTAVVPVAEEAFVFFYNETEARALERFQPWRERVLTVALRELSKNL